MKINFGIDNGDGTHAYGSIDVPSHFTAQQVSDFLKETFAKEVFLWDYHVEEDE